VPTIEVYDPPMCCASGVCGPDPDAELVRFVADLDWLHRQGVKVRRYNLSQEPLAFAQNLEVKGLLEEKGDDGLPAVVVNGRVVAHGSYPTRHALARLAGVADDADLEATGGEDTGVLTPAIAELIAIGAAVASNCEACLKYHCNQARKLGVSNEEMIEAVNVALEVKEAPAGAMVQLAQKLLVPGATAGSSACCRGTTTKRCC
jgi:AhpD family alkylhydroperoxidase